MQHVREAGQGAVHFQHVADGHDALGGVGAMTIRVEPAKLVVVQPETRGLSKKQALSEGPDTLGAGVQAVKRAQEARQGVVHFERLDKLEYTRHVLAVVSQQVVAETVRRE